MAHDDDPLAELSGEVQPPEVLKARVRQALVEQGLLVSRGAGTRRRLAVAGGLAAALLAGVALGWSARGPEAPGGPVPIDQRGQYALLLYEADDFDRTRPESELVAEYSAWAHGIGGQLELGEKLGDDVQLLEPASSGTRVPAAIAGAVGPAGALTGLFIVRAATWEEAVELARTCPHLRYGGRIAVRAIVPT